ATVTMPTSVNGSTGNVMDCKIDVLLAGQRIIDDGDMRLYRALPSPTRKAVGPFVFVDHYRHHSRRGIGDTPHPHAGIEVLSYLLEGGVDHRDSMGFRDRLGPGDAQWIRAGRGILHAEQPLGGRHGLQLWSSLPPAQKFAEPAYASYRAADIPLVERSGARVRVIVGNVENLKGPMVLATPSVFAHVQLDPGATIKLAVDQSAELGLYVLDGAIENGTTSPVAPGTLALLTSGSHVVLTSTGNHATNVAILGGLPAQGPILFAGPFVMDTAERLSQAQRDFSTGKMGRLEGVPF
ncbi:MAG: pirin family protein, partial [Reyranella sp.]|nr:pirin family protein [Reyranella sp.]